MATVRALAIKRELQRAGKLPEHDNFGLAFPDKEEPFVAKVEVGVGQFLGPLDMPHWRLLGRAVYLYNFKHHGGDPNILIRERITARFLDCATWNRICRLSGDAFHKALEEIVLEMRLSMNN